MPASVYFLKNATVLTVGGDDYLGTIKDATASISTKEADHSGPMDDEEYATIVKKRLTISINSFTPASGGADPLAKAGTQVAVVCDAVDGLAINGTFNVTDGEASGSDDAGSNSITLKSVGPWT